MSEGILSGMTGVVFGVANKRSIAWAIAKAWHQAGAKLIFNYQGERLKENVQELVAEAGGGEEQRFEEAFGEGERQHARADEAEAQRGECADMLPRGQPLEEGRGLELYAPPGHQFRIAGPR